MLLMMELSFELLTNALWYLNVVLAATYCELRGGYET